MSELIIPLNKYADIEKWITVKGIRIQDIENILKGYKDDQILFTLLQNYVRKITSTTSLLKYQRLIGPVSISYIKSANYDNKKFYCTTSPSRVGFPHSTFRVGS